MPKLTLAQRLDALEKRIADLEARPAFPYYPLGDYPWSPPYPYFPQGWNVVTTDFSPDIAFALP